MELMETIHENGEKTLIFTQYTEMGGLLSGMFKDRYNTEPLFLHGGTPRKKRDEYVERFQNEKRDKIFLLSLKAGGTGLNLTAASNVIHYDLWWNPAVEAQATDRAYRIGQDKNVMVYRLISKGTLEEKIDKMIKSKKKLADMAMATGEKWIGELSNNELRDILKLG
jgi:SNF2 family DNA or RNA helicase